MSPLVINVAANYPVDQGMGPDINVVERNKPNGIKRLALAFKYSWLGLKAAWRGESAFRQEIALSLAVIPAGIYFGRSGVARALLVAPMFLILIIEMLNSSVEAIVDRVGMERHPLAAIAKDMGSAAVLLSFVLLGIVWILVLLN